MAEKEVTIYATSPCLAGVKNEDGTQKVLKIGESLKVSASEAAKRIATNRFTDKKTFDEIENRQKKVAKADKTK